MPSIVKPFFNSAQASTRRTVLFLTTVCTSDLPFDRPQLACLLPFGHASFIERVLASCARAGLKTIDLVVSDQPEQLRRILKDGWRWGLKLNWHLVKDSATPYGILQNIARQSPSGLLVGHAHQWIAPQDIQALARAPQTGWLDLPTPGWTGWFSMESLEAHLISPHVDEEALVECLPARAHMIATNDFASAANPELLYAAQLLACSAHHSQFWPATWIRQPWGAAHPDAVIHPKARIQGPALIGPGCSVDRNAEIGRHVVLSRDVLIAGGAIVNDAVVLPNTYISSSVTLDHVIVRGNAMRDLKWGVTTQLPEGDGLLLELNPQRAPQTALLSQVVASLLALGLSPAVPLLLGWQVWHGGRLGWHKQEVTLGRHEKSGERIHQYVRKAHQGCGLAGKLVGAYGALLDVAQGWRRWFGVRARNEAQWYALRRDWQILFTRQPIGFFHSPAWSGDPDSDNVENRAAADAFYVVQPQWKNRWRIFKTICLKAVR